MATKGMKTYSLQEMKDQFVGEIGTKEREDYEYELKMDLIGRMIKQARKERKLTQEQLGEIVGVKKSQISKLENNANSATIDTIVKVFKALEAEVNFKVRLDTEYIQLV